MFGETLTAYPVHGGMPFTIEEVNRIPFSGGGVEEKNRVTGVVYVPELQEKKPVRFVERAFEQRREEDYINMWGEYCRAGLGVVPELYLTDQRTLLLTDLKADGSELYGKGLWALMTSPYLREQRHEIKNRGQHPCDIFFKALMGLEQIVDLKSALVDYIDKASNNRIFLPGGDAFELQIRPDARWRLVTLDIASSHVNKSMTKQELLKKHQEDIKIFLDHLYVLKDRL